MIVLDEPLECIQTTFLGAHASVALGQHGIIRRLIVGVSRQRGLSGFNSLDGLAPLLVSHRDAAVQKAF